MRQRSGAKFSTLAFLRCREQAADEICKTLRQVWAADHDGHAQFVQHGVTFCAQVSNGHCFAGNTKAGADTRVRGPAFCPLHRLRTEFPGAIYHVTVRGKMRGRGQEAGPDPTASLLDAGSGPA